MMSNLQEAGSGSGQLLREDGAAKILNVSVAAMRAWRLKGGGPTYVKFGHLVRYRPADIELFITDRLRASTSQPRR